MTTLHSLKNEIEYKTYGGALIPRFMEFTTGGRITGTVQMNEFPVGTVQLGTTLRLNTGDFIRDVRVTGIQRRWGLNDGHETTITWEAEV